MSQLIRRTVPLLLVIGLLAGCLGVSPASVPPSQSAVPSASSAPPASASTAPSGQAPTTPEEAAALVIESDQQFLGFDEKNPDMIGQCCWWEVTQTAEGYRVLLEAGWGDCQAGCIERHRWVYQVTRAGEVILLEESGSPIPDGGIPGGPA
jgi:hypothetical protein